MKMNNCMHILDTNVILAYASDFETNHSDCQKFFSLDYVKTTCSRVIIELNKIRSRRQKLYDDIKKFSDSGLSLKKYTPSIPMKKNDKLHMKDILPKILVIPIYEIRKYIDRKTREIQKGIEKAKKLLKKPFIKPYHHNPLEIGLNKWIDNKADSCILSDSFCWGEENKNYFIFCTNDFSDFINNREDIYYCICGLKGIEYRDKNFEILSVSEILQK